MTLIKKYFCIKAVIIYYEIVIDFNMSYFCNFFDNNLKSATLLVKSISRMLENLEFLSVAVLN